MHLSAEAQIQDQKVMHHTSSLLTRCTPQPGWNLDVLGGLWERSDHTIHKQQRLVLDWHIWVHDWAVSVTFNVSMQTLDVAPADGQPRLAIPGEAVEAFEACLRLQSCLRGCHVHESVAASLPSLEIGWQIHQVILAFESSAIQALSDLHPGAIFRQIVNHQSCASARR